MSEPAIGMLLKEWRARRHLSQLDLASEAGVSSKHLSFVETGRSRPSAELVLDLARHLDVPLREQNDLLLAAGFAPKFSETPLNSPEMTQILASLKRLLNAHQPYPGLILDRHWNVVLNNHASLAIAGLLPSDLLGAELNIFKASLHPDGLSKYTRNFEAWADYLLGKLHRLVIITNDPELAAIEDEVREYPNVKRLGPPTTSLSASLLVPYELTIDGIELSMFTTLTSFGTPRDVTLDNLAVELFFPNDDVTERFFQERAEA